MSVKLLNQHFNHIFFLSTFINPKIKIFQHHSQCSCMLDPQLYYYYYSKIFLFYVYDDNIKKNKMCTQKKLMNSWKTFSYSNSSSSISQSYKNSYFFADYIYPWFYAVLLVAIFSSYCTFFSGKKQAEKKSLQKSIDDDVNENSAKNDTTSFGIKYTTLSIRNNLQDVT